MVGFFTGTRGDARVAQAGHRAEDHWSDGESDGPVTMGPTVGEGPNG